MMFRALLDTGLEADPLCAAPTLRQRHGVNWMRRSHLIDRALLSSFIRLIRKNWYEICARNG
jgi:hypothetical protein